MSSKQFVIGSEWAPTGLWRRGEERCNDPLGALLMGFGAGQFVRDEVGRIFKLGGHVECITASHKIS